jgi:hypothetical protein
VGITEFIAARLDEDEAAAQDAARGNPVPWSLDHAWIRDATGEVVVCDEYRWGGSAFTHIARHDPARALREVAAKRAIVEAYVQSRDILTDNRQAWDLVRSAVGAQRVTVMRLAAIYSGHSDYRAEWKP